LVACHPSASIERTTPVANLQSFSTIALRVRSSGNASSGMATLLESSVAGRLREKCSFSTITPFSQGGTADVVLDLNVTGSNRGGTGWIRNENQVFVDTLLVLSDGQSGDLLGTATIHGKSSGTVVNNAPQENEAIDAIAKSVAGLLAKSGCAGPRVAKAPPEPPPTTGSAGSAGEGSAGTGTVSGPDESKRAEAEALNDKGKEQLFAANTAGALQLFIQANALLADPKYKFNVCVALGAMEKWDDAIAACTEARGMNPSAKLAERIDQRLDGLRHHQ
jgi:hypothetical protein